MDAKHKDILSSQKGLLIRNIIWTENFTNQLLSQHLLTDSTLRDIKATESPDEKSKLLVEALPFKGKNAYTKFCDTLQMTGHAFLADFLRDEEHATDVIDISDLFKKIPNLDKTLNDKNKQQIEHYILEKVKYEKLKDTWRNDFDEKEKALEAKRKQLEQKYSHDKESKDQINEIDDLRNNLVKARNECVEYQATIRALNTKIKDVEERYKNELTVQTKFNMANDHGMDVLVKRFNSLEMAHTDAFSKIMETLGAEQTTKDDRIRGMRGVDEFAYIKLNCEKIMNKLNHLLDIKKQHEHLLDEANWVVSHLGVSSENSSDPGLKKAYQDFIVQNDETILTLKNKVEKCGNMLSEQLDRIDDLTEKGTNNKMMATGASVWQSAIMNVMRGQLQDLKGRYSLRESELSIMKSELAKSKAYIKQLEKNDKSETKLFDLEKTRPGSGTKPSIRLIRHNSQQMVDIVPRLQTDSHNATLPPISHRSPSPTITKERARHNHSKHTPNKSPKRKVSPNYSTVAFRFNESNSTNISNGLGDLRALHNRQKFQQAVIKR